MLMPTISSLEPEGLRGFLVSGTCSSARAWEAAWWPAAAGGSGRGDFGGLPRPAALDEGVAIAFVMQKSRELGSVSSLMAAVKVLGGVGGTNR